MAWSTNTRSCSLVNIDKSHHGLGKEIRVDQRSSMFCRNQAVQPRASPWRDSASNWMVLQKNLTFTQPWDNTTWLNCTDALEKEIYLLWGVCSPKVGPNRIFLHSCFPWTCWSLLGEEQRTCLGQNIRLSRYFCFPNHLGGKGVGLV